MRLVVKSKTFSGYKLHGRCKFQGLPISIENERGSIRSGEDADGHEWHTFMHIPYGYIRLTEGTDGDHVDCYIGPARYSDRVYVVHQNDPTTHKYDEDKVMLGFNSGRDAKVAYMRQYDRPGFFGTMDEYSMAEFRDLLKKRHGVKLKKSYRVYKTRSMGITEQSILEKAEKTIAIDFDGVINSYISGWQGASKTDDPVPGAAAAIRTILDLGYDVAIYSTRAKTKEGKQAIRDFCIEKLDIDASGMEITDRKPIAEAYIDDRAINFSGDWKSTISKLKRFKPYMEKALRPERRMVTRGGKTFMTTVYVSSTKKEQKEQARKTALVVAPKVGRERVRSTVKLMEDHRKIIDFAPDDSKAVDKVLSFQKEYFKGKEPPSMYEVVQAATEETQFALKREDSGKNWYQDSMAKARATLSERFPDLSGETEWDFFLSILAISSPTQAPGPNMKSAVTIYEHYKDTGEIPVLNPKTGKAFSIASTQIMKNFKETLGTFASKRDFVQFMNGVSEVGELSEKYGARISGRANEPAFNSMIFGEKVGMFYQSMRGTAGAVAVDKWAIRSFYRWTGTLRAGTASGVEAGAPRQRVIHEKMGAEERKAVEYVMQTVGEKLDLSSSQVQAVMWYYEKRLYEKLGMKGMAAETTDFADAAKKLYMQKSMTAYEFEKVLSRLIASKKMPSFYEFMEAIMAIRMPLEKARKKAVGTVVYRRDGAFKKVAEGKWIPVPKRELEQRRGVYAKVREAVRGVRTRDYNLSTIEGHQKMNQAVYARLKQIFGDKVLPYSRYMQIVTSDKYKTGMDQQEAIAEAIEKKQFKPHEKKMVKKSSTIAGIPEGTLIKADLPDLEWACVVDGHWTLFEFHPECLEEIEKAVRAKKYVSPEEVKARGMRWVTIRGARVLLQPLAEGGYAVVGGAGGRLAHLKIEKILGKEEYARRVKERHEEKRKRLRELTPAERAEQARARREEVKQKREVREQYKAKVMDILGVDEDKLKAQITVSEMDELSNRARTQLEKKWQTTKISDEELQVQTEKEVQKELKKRVKNIERLAVDTVASDYMGEKLDPSAKAELRKLLDPAKAMEILRARKEFKKATKQIGRASADIAPPLKVGDVFAGDSKSLDKDILAEIEQNIETQKNIQLYDRLNAQSLSIQKHVDTGSMETLNGLIGDVYGGGAVFSPDTVEQLGLEAVIRSTAIKLQRDGKADAVKKALEDFSAREREKIVTEALNESDKRFQNADALREMARGSEDGEALLSMASANGHALKQLTAGQRTLGTAVGSLRAMASMINALDEPQADSVLVDVGKDLSRARKKAKEAGLARGTFRIKTEKAGRGKRLVMEIPADSLDQFFQRNQDMRKEETRADQIKTHGANTGYKPPGIKDSIKLDPAQEAGLLFFKEKGKVLLDFEAGLGKTAVGYAAAMEAMNNMGAKKVLIVTPAKLRRQMYDDRETFLDKEHQKNVRVSTQNTKRSERIDRYGREGIHIIGHDQLRTDADAIKEAGYDMVVVDEIHEMTSIGSPSGRYQGMMKLADIPMKIGMSGTNIKNKKKELHKKINFIDPEHSLGSVADFEKRYKGLNQGTGAFTDSANQAFRKEIAPWVYTQKNVLPVKNDIETVRVPLTKKQRAKYAESERIYRDERERKVPGAAARRDARNYSIVQNDEHVDNAKVNRMVNIMRDNHTGEKAVVHVMGLNAMRTAKARIESEFGPNSVAIIHGESPPGEVANAKAAFNDPGNPLRFIVGTKAIEAGHNFQGGGTVTFHLDLPDTYAAFDQRNKRIYRKGQDRDTKSYVMSGLNPLDMRKEDILAVKKREMEILGNPREIEGMDGSGFYSTLKKYEGSESGISRA